VTAEPAEQPLIGPAPFTRAQARAAGVSDRQLQHRRYVRVLPRVWRHVDHKMSDEDWRSAALLALPPRVHLTGITRLQQLGLDYGPRLPVRCVVEGDLHLAYDHVFLHRTKRLPPTDEIGVCVAAAFMAYARLTRVIDAVKVGDWLLHRGHLDLAELERLATSALWRAGADEALWVLPHLDGRARSVKESELRCVLAFAGLPTPAVNAALPVGPDAEAYGDLVYRPWRTVVEYEGGHHQTDRATYRSDIDRYALFRTHGHDYVQITAEHLGRPRAAVLRVDQALRRAGYDGQAPAFGEHWRTLFASVATAVGPRDRDRRAG